MIQETAVHQTKTITRQFPVSRTRLFQAWANVEARSTWGSPSPEVTLRYDQADFVVGGADDCVCVYEGQDVHRVITRWLDIVENRRLVFSEMMTDLTQTMGGSLVTVEFFGDDRQSSLVVTLQTVALDGLGLEAGVVEGWTGAMELLAAYLAG